MKKIILFGLWLPAVAILSAAGLELFCFLFPILPINRPCLQRVLDFPEFKTLIRTNSLGLREDGEIPRDKDPGEKRIFLVGDSFVFGFGVEKEDTLSVQLQECLAKRFPDKRVRVINAASAGTGPVHYDFTVRNIALPLHADAVVVCLYLGNDLENTVSPYLVFPYSLKNHFKRWFPNAYVWASAYRHNRKLPAGDPASQKVGVDPWSIAELHRWGKWEGIPQQEMDRRFSAISGKARAWLDQGMVSPAYAYSALTHPQILEDTMAVKSPGTVWGLLRTQRLIDKMHRACARSGVSFLLVLIPHGCQVNDAQWDFYRTLGFSLNPSQVQSTKLQDELTAFCRKEGIACLDLLPVLRKAPLAQLHYQRDEHWRPATVQYVANILANVGV